MRSALLGTTLAWSCAPRLQVLPMSVVSRFAVVVVAGLTFAGDALDAQVPPAGAPMRTPSGPGEIRGRLLETGTARPIAGGSVTVRRSGDTVFAGGALPRPDGSFHVD